MRGEQLDLPFHQAPAVRRPADVVVFPIDRQRRRLEREAAYIVGRDQKKLDWHVRDHLRMRHNELARIGVPNQIIGQEIRAYLKALETEMARQRVIRFLFGSSAGGAA